MYNAENNEAVIEIHMSSSVLTCKRQSGCAQAREGKRGGLKLLHKLFCHLHLGFKAHRRDGKEVELPVSF